MRLPLHGECPLVLAPLARVNDVAFRRLCREYGASLVYTGMIHARAIIHNQGSALSQLQYAEEERPVAFQLFGTDPGALAQAAGQIQHYADVIDINCGCPDRDVLQQGAGASLLSDPDHLGRILQRVRGAVSCPVTAKIRIGVHRYEWGHLRRVVDAIEEAGLDGLAVHGRTARQGYTGRADWSVIRDIVDYSRMPVIGNGDVASCEDALTKQADTGCAGIMIGRAAMGNPAIFAGAGSHEERLRALRSYLSYAATYADVSSARTLASLRMHTQFFLHGFAGARAARRRLAGVKSYDELVALVSEIEAGMA